MVKKIVDVREETAKRKGNDRGSKERGRKGVRGRKCQCAREEENKKQ